MSGFAKGSTRYIAPHGLALARPYDVKRQITTASDWCLLEEEGVPGIDRRRGVAVGFANVLGSATRRLACGIRQRGQQEILDPAGQPSFRYRVALGRAVVTVPVECG